MSVKESKISVIDSKQCDTLSKLADSDIRELLRELKSYSFALRDKLELSRDIKFGTEIEFENAPRDTVKESLDNIGIYNNEWSLNFDYSVNSNREIMGKTLSCGGEIVSPILKDNVNCWRELKLICEMLKKSNAFCGDKSGGHVHIGTQILDECSLYWIRFIKLWTVYERIIYRFTYGDKLGPRGEINTYSKPLSNQFYNLLPRMKETYHFGIIRYLLPKDNNMAIYFNNLKSDDEEMDNTIEFRCPNGTLNPVIWQNNINLLCRILETCKSYRYDDDLIERKLREYSIDSNNLSAYQGIYLQEALEFFDLIFPNNLDKIYSIHQYIKEFDEKHINSVLKK